MKNNRVKLLFVLGFCFLTHTSKVIAQSYEWNMSNTGSNPGERVVLSIDAGSIGTYDGISITGSVIDNVGNWGYNLPIKAKFACYINFSGSNYQIVQSAKTSRITLRLREISSSVIHLTANMPYHHSSAIIDLKIGEQNGLSSVTLGNPNVIDSSGALILNEPEYETILNGNVGIGTTTPDSKLTVAGNIHAQEVKVTISAGADFVFNADYNLPKLEDVEQFIKENKYLPEIASEKEMQDNGLLLAEMNIKLLQKVEELTLYTIEQEKQLKSQKNTNKKLENRLSRLEQLVLKTNE